MGAKDRLRHLMAMRAEREISRETPTHEITADVRQKIDQEVAAAVFRKEHVSSVIGRVSKDIRTPTLSPNLSPAKNPKKSAATPPPSVNQMLNKAQTPHIPVPVEGKQKDMWATIAKQAYQEQLEYQTQERLAKNEKIRLQKQVLDEQVSIRKTIKSKTSEVQKADRKSVDDQKVVWDREQRETTSVHRTIADQLRADREAQVAERKVRREIEAVERQKADKAILQRIDVELEQQKVRTKELKEREIRMKDELIVANEEQKKIKESFRHKEAELEAKCIVEMEARLEKQQQDRERAWKEMKEKMKGREALALELQATLDEKGRADEERAQEVTEARFRAREEKDKAEQDKRKAGLLKVLEFQYKQIEEKNHELELEKLRKIDEKRDAEVLVKDSIIAIEMKKKEQRDKIALQKRILKDQMKDNSRYQSVIISDEEKNLNKHILERADGVESPSRFKRNFSPI